MQVDKEVYRSDDHSHTMTTFTNIYPLACRDLAANVLFEDSGDDRPISTCIMESLMKVPLERHVTFSNMYIM